MRSALRPPVGQRGGGLLADRGDLEAGEGTSVEAVLLELLAHGAHRVDRGERDPLVAGPRPGRARALSICSGLRGGSTEMVGTSRGGAVAAKRDDSAPACSLVRGHQHAPAEQRLGLEPRQRVALVDDRATRHGRGVMPPRGRPAAIWPSVETTVSWVSGCRCGSSTPGCRRAAGGDQLVGDLADGADGREQHQRRVGGVRRQSTLASLHVTTATSRWFLGVCGMPAYAGRRSRRDAGDDLEADVGLGAGSASSGPEA